MVEKETFLSPETLADFSHWLQSPDWSKGGDRLASLRQSRCIFRARPLSTPSKPGWLKVEERELPGKNKSPMVQSEGCGEQLVWGRGAQSVYNSEAGFFLGCCGLGLWEGVAGFSPSTLPRELPEPGPPGTCDPVLEKMAVWQEETRQLSVLQSYSIWNPKQLLIFAINCSSGSETGKLFWGSVEATRIGAN